MLQRNQPNLRKLAALFSIAALSCGEQLECQPSSHQHGTPQHTWFLKVCLQWNVPLMWDRFITYLLSTLAQPFLGFVSDHFRCRMPDHEVMAACKHTRHELESSELVFVWPWEWGRQYLYVYQHLGVHMYICVDVQHERLFFYAVCIGVEHVCLCTSVSSCSW